VNPAAAEAQLARGRAIEGWFSFEAGMLFAWIDAIQRDAGITGDVFEIGVHHGKSATLLAALLRDGERLRVCDLFGSQDANVSRSGSGQRDVFEANVRALVPGAVPEVFACASSQLDAARLGAGHRLFHVDGGHNPEEALADLELAAACTGERGVIALDDPFQPAWPGVTEGLLRFLDRDDRFVAVVLGFNKLLLARREHASLYAARLDDREERRRFLILYPWQMKKLPLHGDELRIFHVPSWRSLHSLRTRAVRSIDRSALARKGPFKAIASRLRSKLAT
jgi:hypothetical protein